MASCRTKADEGDQLVMGADLVRDALDDRSGSDRLEVDESPAEAYRIPVGVPRAGSWARREE